MGSGKSKEQSGNQEKQEQQEKQEKQEKQDLADKVKILESESKEQKEAIEQLKQTIQQQQAMKDQQQKPNEIQVPDQKQQANQNDEKFVVKIFNYQQADKHENLEVKDSQHSNIQKEQQQVLEQSKQEAQTSQVFTNPIESKIEEKQQQQQIKSQSQQIQESNQLIQASMINTKKQQKNENENENENKTEIHNSEDYIPKAQKSNENTENQDNFKSEIKLDQEIKKEQQQQSQSQSYIPQPQTLLQSKVSQQSQILNSSQQPQQQQQLQQQQQEQYQEQQQQQQQQQQQKSSIFQQDGNKYQEIKSKINETASKIILEKSKSQIGSKITQKAPKVKFCLKQVMDSLTMLGKLAYKTQAYYEVFGSSDQYRMKYINDLIQMINMNLILFDEIGLYDEDYKEIRNQIKTMLTAFLKSHKFHSQIIEQFKFLINYCTQPELKQIDAIQYDITMPIIQESASLLEEQYLNFTKLKETYENGDMEAVDVEKQENPFLVCEMVKFKDDFYTKSLDEAKRIIDKTSFDKFLLKLQSNLNQEAFIHFSTLLRLFNDFLNQKSTNWAEQLQQYCDKIKEQGHAVEVVKILIDYTQLGHKYCFQYLYTAIFYLQNEEQKNSNKFRLNQLLNQLDKM